MNDTEQDYRPPEPIWADYLADRWHRLPGPVAGFLAVFAFVLVTMAMVSVTVWLFANGWNVTGAIAASATFSAFVTTLCTAMIRAGE